MLLKTKKKKLVFVRFIVNYSSFHLQKKNWIQLKFQFLGQFPFWEFQDYNQTALSLYSLSSAVFDCDDLSINIRKSWVTTCQQKRKWLCVVCRYVRKSDINKLQATILDFLKWKFSLNNSDSIQKFIIII